MKIKSLFASAAIAAAVSSSAFALTNIDPVTPLGSVAPYSSFSSTVYGEFTETWSFQLSVLSEVSVSLDNVERSFNSTPREGILSFAAWLDGTPLDMTKWTSVYSLKNKTTTQSLAGDFFLPAGRYELTVSGDGVTGTAAMYNGAIGAIGSTAVAASVPEPESYAMFLAGLGVMGAIVARRRKSTNSV